MKNRGKYALLWKNKRREWVRANPPNHQGYYICWICSKWVKAEEMELDHIKSRVRYPSLRFESSNLAPSCRPCNTKKGSGDAPTVARVIQSEDLENLLDL